MTTNRLKLTTTAVEKLRTAGIYWDTQVPGLGVRVSDSGRCTYFLKKRVKGGTGKERTVSLGRHGDPVLMPNGALRTFPFGTDDARARAAAVQAQMLMGVDPVQKRKDDEAAEVAKAKEDEALSTTLRQVLEKYIHTKTVRNRKLRPRTITDYRDIMDRFCADWLDKPVANINRHLCLEMITEIEARSPAQAHKTQVYLHALLTYAREDHSTDDGYPILAVNPISRMKRVKRMHPPEPRDRRIPLGRVGQVWSALRRAAMKQTEVQGPRDRGRTGADWVSTLLLTGMRATECAALEWSWIDWTAKTLTLPGDVVPEGRGLFFGTKNHATFVYPLSDVLHDLLKARSELPNRHQRFVFPAMSDKLTRPYITSAHGTMAEVVKAAGCKVSPHDLRRTLMSLALTCKVDHSLRMRLLNHKPAGVHDSAYEDKDPETLRPAVNAIANFIIDAAHVAEAQAAGTNIVSLSDRIRG
jgi:integrase